MSENKAVAAWKEWSQWMLKNNSLHPIADERIVKLSEKGDALSCEIERLEESLKQTAEVLHEANNLAEAAIKDKERLEAENTKLRKAAVIAIEFLSRLDNSTSKHDACMRTLEHALERK